MKNECSSEKKHALHLGCALGVSIMKARLSSTEMAWVMVKPSLSAVGLTWHPAVGRASGVRGAKFAAQAGDA